MKIFFRLFVLSLVFVFNFITIECSAISAEKIVMVSHAGAGDPFWDIVFKGAVKAAEETGVDLTLLAPETPNDKNRQIELLNSVISQNPDGIATTVHAQDAFSSSLKSARKKNIPIIAFNTKPMVDDRIKNPYMAYIGMDDFLSGKNLAQEMLKSNKNFKHVVVANHQFGHSGLSARFKGISDVLRQRNIFIEHLDITINPITIEKVVIDYINKHKNIDAIITLGANGTHTIGKLIRKKKLNIYQASFDVSPLTIKMIKDGIVDFTIDQQPYMQGYLSVKLLVLTSRYKMYPPDVNTGIGIINKENVAEVEDLSKKKIR